MPNVASIGNAVKPSGARIRIPCDFGDSVLLINGYAITSYQVTATGDGVLLISGQQLDYPYQLSAVFSSGSPGSNYQITYTVTLNDPDVTILTCSGNLSVI